MIWPAAIAMCWIIALSMGAGAALFSLFRLRLLLGNRDACLAWLRQLHDVPKLREVFHEACNCTEAARRH